MNAVRVAPEVLPVGTDGELRLQAIENSGVTAISLLSYFTHNREYILDGDPNLSPLNTMEDAMRAVHDMAENRSEGVSAPYGIVYHDEFVGLCTLRERAAGRAILGYNRASDERLDGQGIVTRSARTLLDWAWDEYRGWGLHCVDMAIVPDNIRSRRVAWRLGATLFSEVSSSEVPDKQFWRLTHGGQA